MPNIDWGIRTPPDMREIHLDGGEVTMLKAIGLGGTPMSGATLMERTTGLEEAMFLETLDGLITVGYILCDKPSLHSFSDVKGATLSVNPGYSKQLRAALDPESDRPKSRRVRRE
jgi:hypothetical protein